MFLLDYIDLISIVEVMGCEQSAQDQIAAPNRSQAIHPTREQPKLDLNQSQMAVSQHGYQIPQLQNLIKKAFDDLRSRDPMGKRLYLNQILNFILAWLPKAMNKGMTLFDAEKIVRQDLERACKAYPIAQVEQIATSVEAIGKAPYPDLFADVKNKTKQTFTDRIKELCQRSKEVSYEFNKQMQLILEKDGGYKFITGYKFTGSKAYLRIMTKVLDPFLSEKEQSRQVYTDLNHYYYLPVFHYFNTLIDKNIKNLKIELYDWIRCKCSFKNIYDLEKAFLRLKDIHGSNIFRVKNRINQNTRDLLINLKFKTDYTQIQLALQYDDQSYEFQHKLYELTREKLGVAYSCFTFMLNDSGDDHGSSSGVMTSLGYLKKTILREKVEPNFERLTYEDAEILHEDVKNLLGKWGVASLKTGYADASNQNSLLKKQFYGPDTEIMLIIKKKQNNNQVFNWLNWMD